MRNTPGLNDGNGGVVTAELPGDAAISWLRVAEVTVTAGGAPMSGRRSSDGAEALSRAASRKVRTIRIGRALTGLFLVLHGIAHATVGTAPRDPTRTWRVFDGTMLETPMLGLTSLLWAASMIGFVAAGLGLLGVAGLRRHSPRLILAAAVASVLLLAFDATSYAMAGAVIDVALLALIGYTSAGQLRGRWIWHHTLLEDATTRRLTPQR